MFHLKALKVNPLVAYVIAIIVVAVFTATVYFMAAPVLSYAEGWCTFYWDSHHISSMMSSGHTQELLHGFFLQFFACKWIGVTLMTAVTLLLSILLGVIIQKSIKNKSWLSGAVACVCLSLVFNILLPWWLSGLPTFTLLSQNDKNVRVMIYSDMVRRGEWKEISDDFSSANTDLTLNFLAQNCRNMALAEQGLLGDHLFDIPCVDIRSIYQVEIQSPQVAALMSDIYYSMGHIAMSQRYAFEANEKMGNFSPRLLQRLTQTALIYGNDALAEKYLYLLKKTLFYKDWCDEVRHSSSVAEKKSCLFPDNRFSGIHGLDDDLLNVARSSQGTSQQERTLQYLGSLYLLAGYQEEMDSLIHEFYEDSTVNRPLPKYFRIKK